MQVLFRMQDIPEDDWRYDAKKAALQPPHVLAANELVYNRVMCGGVGGLFACCMGGALSFPDPMTRDHGAAGWS